MTSFKVLATFIYKTCITFRSLTISSVHPRHQIKVPYQSLQFLWYKRLQNSFCQMFETTSKFRKVQNLLVAIKTEAVQIRWNNYSCQQHHFYLIWRFGHAFHGLCKRHYAQFSNEGNAQFIGMTVSFNRQGNINFPSVLLCLQVSDPVEYAK